MESMIERAISFELVILMLLIIITTIFHVVKCYQLGFYLKKNYSEFWIELHTLKTRWGNFIGGNPEGVYGFIFSNLNNEDENILSYKHSIKSSILHFLAYVAALIVSMFILMMLPVIFAYIRYGGI